MEESEAAEEMNSWGKIPESEYYKNHNIRGSRFFYTSPRGLSLFTRSWVPAAGSPRAVVCGVHGYANDISWTFQSTQIFLAEMGFACFALDIEGHGRSDGLRCFVPNVDLVVQDCISFFNLIKQEPLFQNLPFFLYGESLGGAICLLIHLADPEGFDGAILVAPMCKISDKVKPRFPIPQILTLMAKLFPTLAIVPTEDLVAKSVKVEEKRMIGEMNPMRYRGKPRLGTVTELLRVTEFVAERLGDVTVPFLVVHGSADVVTDPSVSRELYEKAKSGDKTMKIYQGMFHSLLFGETEENVDLVRKDILDWLIVRSKK